MGRPKKRKKQKRRAVKKSPLDDESTTACSSSSSSPSESSSESTSSSSSPSESSSETSEDSDDEDDSLAAGNRDCVRSLVGVRGRPRSRLPCDRRKMRILAMFDPPSSFASARRGSEAMLARAKRAVVKEIWRQERLGKRGRPSPLEQAFLDASQEDQLTFDYAGMRSLVQKAVFEKKSSSRNLVAQNDFAWNDNRRVVINRRVPLVVKQLQIVLMHECLHNTVERDGKPGNPQLSEEIEHTAMAFLGDREEQAEYFRRHFNMDYDEDKLDRKMNLDQRRKRRLDKDYLKRSVRVRAPALDAE